MHFNFNISLTLYSMISWFKNFLPELENLRESNLCPDLSTSWGSSWWSWATRRRCCIFLQSRSHYPEEMKTKVGRGETKAKVCQGGGRCEGRGAMENFEKEKVGEETRRLLQNRTQWSGVFLASSPNFCSPVCFSRNGCLCIEYTSQSLVQKTVQMPQFINRWGAVTGVIRRYGSLMRPGRSTPPIYTCFDPSGVRNEGGGAW